MPPPPPRRQFAELLDAIFRLDSTPEHKSSIGGAQAASIRGWVGITGNFPSFKPAVTRIFGPV
eukprot:937882-Pyramimonas_sp.AAC.1